MVEPSYLGQNLSRDLVPGHICGSKSRIDLIISGSGIKHPKLSAGDIQEMQLPPNPEPKRVRTSLGRKQI